MKNNLSFIGLLKETIDMARDSRPYDRGALRPHMLRLLKRELIKITPDGYTKFADNQIEFMFLCTVFVEKNICTDLIAHFAKFWAEDLEDRIQMTFQIERSLSSGPLRTFIETDMKERLTLKPNYISELVSILIPESNSEQIQISEKIVRLSANCLTSGT